MNCALAIDRLLPEWKSLLETIGLNYTITDIRDRSAESYPVWIITQLQLEADTKLKIRRFVQDGGCVWIGASAADAVWNFGYHRRRLHFLQPDHRFLNNQILHLNCVTRVSASANALPDQQNRFTIQIPTDHDPSVIVTPDSLLSGLSEYGYAHQYFYGEGGWYYPMETVSRVNKGALRRLVQQLLRYLFHRAGLPFIHLSYIPLSSNLLFCFRLDTDYSNEAALQEFNNMLETFQFKASWFIETGTGKRFLPFYRRFSGHELAYHCHRHRTYLSEKRNETDFRTGLEILRNSGIVPKGYAAPQGIWNPILAESIAQFGFEYSSEFSWAYDDLPHTPFTKRRFYPTLQVPVHPISAGRLIQARYSDPQITDYYLQQIRQAIQRFEPVCLYDHPAHQKVDCWKPVFRYLAETGACNMTFLEFARWWKRRNQIRVTADWNLSGLHINTEDPDPDIGFIVEFPDHSSYHLPSKSSVWKTETLAPYKLQYSEPADKILPDKIIHTARKDLRLYYNEWLSRYRRWKQ